MPINHSGEKSGNEQGQRHGHINNFTRDESLQGDNKKFEEKTPDSEMSTTSNPNEEMKAADLSTTIDQNAETNEDDGQRTDIGTENVSFSVDNTLVMSKETDNDKSGTEVYSTTNDESHTEVSKAVQGSKEVGVNADISERTESNNDGTENAMQSDVVNIEGEKGEESKNSDAMSAPLFTEPTEERSNVSKNSDTEEHTLKPKKRRLGMTRPAFTKSTLSVNVSDVSKDFEMPKEQKVVKTCISEGKQVVRKYMCKKHQEMFFTKNGYQ